MSNQFSLEQRQEWAEKVQRVHSSPHTTCFSMFEKEGHNFNVSSLGLFVKACFGNAKPYLVPNTLDEVVYFPWCKLVQDRNKEIALKILNESMFSNVYKEKTLEEVYEKGISFDLSFPPMFVYAAMIFIRNVWRTYYEDQRDLLEEVFGCSPTEAFVGMYQIQKEKGGKYFIFNNVGDGMICNGTSNFFYVHDQIFNRKPLLPEQVSLKGAVWNLWPVSKAKSEWCKTYKSQFYNNYYDAGLYPKELIIETLLPEMQKERNA